MVWLGGIPLYYDMKLNNVGAPIFDLKVTQDKQEMFEGSLRPGGIADLGVYKLQLIGVVPWMSFSLALDKGVFPIFAGFIITLLGFLLHMLFWPRRVEWVLKGDQWRVQAWVRKGDLTFEQKWNDWCHEQGLEAIR